MHHAGVLLDHHHDAFTACVLMVCGLLLAACRRGLREATRWAIPAHGSVSLLVQFASDSVGKFSEVLGFDVLRGERNQKVVLTGACDYPRISTEAR
jgi:hypothetical protein